MNVQQHILKGIKELLFSHNYLVIPGFGGFVLKSSPSHFSASGGMLLPPSKTVSFNAQLKQNDGVMVFWLQAKLSCTASEALLHLNDFSAFCSGVLTAKRRLSLDGIGFFYIDFENNICFEPQQDANFLSDSFGLFPLSLNPVGSIEPETIKETYVKETLFIDRKADHEQIHKPALTRVRKFKGVINAVVLVALSLSLLIILATNTRSGGLLYSSALDSERKGLYSPLVYSELNVQSPILKKAGYVADANGIACLELENNKTLAVLAIENKFESGKVLSLASTHQFEIVLGCFTVLSNAQRMNKQLHDQRIHTSISPKNAKGMYVISNGSYTSKEEAMQRLQQLKQLFPKAWIKKAE